MVIAQALADRDDLLMALIDRTGKLLWANRAFVNYSQRSLEALIGKKFFQALAPEASDLPQQTYIREQLIKGESFKFEFAYRASQQSEIQWLLIDGKPIADAEGIVSQYSLLANDISLRKQAELSLQEAKNLLQKNNQILEERVQQRTTELRNEKERVEQTLRELQATQAKLIQQEKMSSLGQLVAGIAHEINNPVNFIHGNIAHARTYVEDLLDFIHTYQQQYPDPVAAIEEKAEEIDLEFLYRDLPSLLDSMQVGTNRIREIVLSLRNFSRINEAELKSVDIHSGIDSTLMILQHRLKKKSDSAGIEVIKEYGCLPRVECYPGKLNQVFMNLLANAIDALTDPDQPPSKSVQKTPHQICIRTTFIEPNRVKIAIADNGSGIPTQVQASIFDPFFTTKSVGKGTGLGLAISRQVVVENHGGKLYFSSQPEHGTEFVIELPVEQPRPTVGTLQSGYAKREDIDTPD